MNQIVVTTFQIKVIHNHLPAYITIPFVVTTFQLRLFTTDLKGICECNFHPHTKDTQLPHKYFIIYQFHRKYYLNEFLNLNI
jgi:hypothetical protein